MNNQPRHALEQGQATDAERAPSGANGRQHLTQSDGAPESGCAERRVIFRLLGATEDAIYALTAFLLLGAALYVLVTAAIVLVSGVLSLESGVQAALTTLDYLLLVLIFVELFYTVRLSIRERALAVEPFIAVALIATVRRILVLTAEEQRVLEDAALFQRLLLELGVLAALVMVLVIALMLLRRARSDTIPEGARTDDVDDSRATH